MDERRAGRAQGPTWALVAAGIATLSLAACAGDDSPESTGPAPADSAAGSPAADGSTTVANSEDAAAADRVVVTVMSNLVDDFDTLNQLISTTSEFQPALGRIAFDQDDPKGPSLVLDINSAAQGDEQQDAVAWGAYFAFAQLWGPQGGLRNEVGAVRPGLTVVVDGRTFFAPMERMVQLHDFLISKQEFLALSRADGA